MIKHLFRYERSIPLYDSLSENITLQEYPVIKETSSGYWIEDFGNGKKWVSKSARKRFAYPTEEEAYENFTKRTERCIKILEARLNTARMFLKAPRLFESRKTTLSA